MRRSYLLLAAGLTSTESVVIPPGDQEQVYGPEPPLASAMSHVLVPLQNEGEEGTMVALTGAGAKSLVVMSALHPKESVTVTLYVPAPGIVAIGVVCGGVVCQE